MKCTVELGPRELLGRARHITWHAASSSSSHFFLTPLLCIKIAEIYFTLFPFTLSRPRIMIIYYFMYFYLSTHKHKNN